MENIFATQLAFAFVFGLRHAGEPDHLVAVSTLVHDERRLRNAMRVGFSWGLGHTSTLVLGVALIPLLGIQLAEAHLHYFELPVGVLLVALGVKALRDAVTRRAPALRHGEAEAAVRRAQWRSYGVGIVHGLAGSGALVLLVSATLGSATEAVTYALSYGAGSVAGMSAVTLLLAAPFAASRRRPALLAAWIALSGGLSVLLGGMILWELAQTFS